MACIPPGVRTIAPNVVAVDATMYPRKRYRQTIPSIPDGRFIRPSRKARRADAKVNVKASKRLFVLGRSALTFGIGV